MNLMSRTNRETHLNMNITRVGPSEKPTSTSLLHHSHHQITLRLSTCTCVPVAAPQPGPAPTTAPELSSDLHPHSTFSIQQPFLSRYQRGACQPPKLLHIITPSLHQCTTPTSNNISAAPAPQLRHYPTSARQCISIVTSCPRTRLSYSSTATLIRPP